MKFYVDFDVERYNEMCSKLEEYDGKYEEVVERQVQLDEKLDSLIDEEDRLNESNIYLEEEKKKLISEKMISFKQLTIFNMSLLVPAVILGGLVAGDVLDVNFLFAGAGVFTVCVFGSPLISFRIDNARKVKIENSDVYKELEKKQIGNNRDLEKLQNEIELLESEIQKSCDEVDYWQKLINEVKKEIDMCKSSLFESVERQIDDEDIERVEDKSSCKKRVLVNVSQFKKMEGVK